MMPPPTDNDPIGYRITNTTPPLEEKSPIVPKPKASPAVTAKVGDGPDLDPTNHELVNPDATTANTPKKPEPFDATPCDIPPNHPALTHMRATNEFGVGGEIAMWRKLANIGQNATQYLLPYIQKSIAESNPSAELGIAPTDIDNGIAITKKLLAEGKSKKELYEALTKVHPNMNKFLALRLRNQFGRGTSTLEEDIGTLSDLNFFQWLDKKGNYQANEILDCLQTAKYYYGKALEQPDPNNPNLWELAKYTVEPGSTERTRTPLVEINVDPKAHKVSYTLKSNTYEGVVGLADQIASHRQGHSNKIKLNSVGDPIAFIMLNELLICKHNMQVELPPDVLAEVHKALENPPLSDNPNIDALRTRWELLESHRMSFSHKTQKQLYQAPASLDGGPNHHAAVVERLQKMLADDTPYRAFKGRTATPTSPVPAAAAVPVLPPLVPPPPPAPKKPAGGGGTPAPVFLRRKA